MRKTFKEVVALIMSRPHSTEITHETILTGRVSHSYSIRVEDVRVASMTRTQLLNLIKRGFIEETRRTGLKSVGRIVTYQLTQRAKDDAKK